MNSSDLHDSTGHGRGRLTGISARGRGRVLAGSGLPHAYQPVLRLLTTGSSSSAHAWGRHLKSVRFMAFPQDDRRAEEWGSPVIRGSVVWGSQWAAPREQVRPSQGKKRFRLYYPDFFFFLLGVVNGLCLWQVYLIAFCSWKIIKVGVKFFIWNNVLRTISKNLNLFKSIDYIIFFNFNFLFLSFITRTNYSGHMYKNKITYIKLAIIIKIKNSKCWWGCRKIASLVHCFWECKVVQQPQKILWWFLKKVKCILP